MVCLFDCGGEDMVAGEVEHVEGAFTAMESLVDAAVERDVFEAVRRKEAARQARGAAGAGAGALLLGVLLEVLLIRAASWFKDGSQPPMEGLAGASLAGGAVEVIVERRTVTSLSNSDTGSTACVAGRLPFPHSCIFLAST
jgi:hypothetical protein